MMAEGADHEEPAGADLHPVSRKSTPALVADQLRAAIMRGTLPPGSQLGEVELAGRLGVSRGPLREAMQHLVAEGLVRGERHRGLFVRELDEDDVHDIYSARLAVEQAAALCALAQDRVAAAAALTEALEVLEAAAEQGDPVALADADHAFHATMVAAAGSPRLRRMAEGLLVETRMCLAAMQETAPAPGQLLREHRELRDAMLAGDGDRLTRCLEAHMSDAVARVVASPDVTRGTRARTAEAG